MRNFFMMCNFMYTKNPSFLTPFHNILAEWWLTQVASSPDSYDWYVTYHAELQHEKKLSDENVFTVASVDNFNMLQSYSAVYHNNKERSYHSTTVQIVQPNSQYVITQPQTNAIICYIHTRI